jgi:2-(1,2-epoxy-1,2-dihydrophenyl)acetyl-CoA isomerase
MTDTSEQPVTEHRDGSVAIIRLNEPQKRNALSRALKRSMSQIVPMLIADSSVRCIIVTGNGEAFCAGGDISDMSERDAPAVTRRLSDTHSWARQIALSPKPFVAAVNGAATGAGFGLALLCDILVASEGAVFRSSFPSVGASPDMALGYTLPRSVGMARAREILLLNKPLPARLALAWGAINLVVPPEQLMEQALKVAHALGDGPTAAYGLAKDLLGESYSSLHSYLKQEAHSQAVAFGTSDFAEGVSAFLERRKPSFTGC